MLSPNPTAEGAVSLYQTIIPDNVVVSDLFEQAKQMYSQMSNIVNFMNIPDMDLQDCQSELQSLDTYLNEIYTHIVNELHILERTFPIDSHPEVDFSIRTAENFHDLFSKTLDLDLLSIELKLRIERANHENFRSYEPAFKQLNTSICSKMDALSPRLTSYLTDYSVQDKPRQNTLVTLLDILRTYKNSHIKTESFRIIDNQELNNAVRFLNRFQSVKDYTLSQYNRFQRLAERILLESCRPGKIGIPKAMQADPEATLKNIEMIINGQDATSEIFSKTPKTIDALTQMLVMSFIKLRGRPTASSEQAPNLVNYLNGSNTKVQTLREGLQELTATQYWESNCGEDFKQRINDALRNPIRLNEFKEHLDQWVIKENLGSIDIGAQKEFEVFHLVSAFRGELVAYGNPYRDVIEALSRTLSENASASFWKQYVTYRKTPRRTSCWINTISAID
ncbi:MAG: hypothetical protein ACPGEF_04845 [Endozoicomonas sp.]